MVLDQFARSILLAGLIGTGIVAYHVYRRIDRYSRKTSILAMVPTLTIWTLFEISVLVDWSFTLSIWLSRLGVISIIGTLLLQLWSIDYAEHTERRMRDALP
jgi:hypothetical protein